MLRTIFKTGVPMGRASLGLLIALCALWAAYFYILLGPSTDLQQMRRILLSGPIVILSCLILSFSFFKCLGSGPHEFLRNKWNPLSLAFIFLVMTSVAFTFQMRLPDAFRHAYASAFLSYYTNTETAVSLGNLVEWVTSFKKNKLFNSGMDQCNNHYGRQIALDIKKQRGSWIDVENKIDQSYKNGDLILSKHQHLDIISCYKEIFPHEAATIAEMQKAIANSR